MFGIGQGELIFIILVAIILLGPKKLPEATRMIARFYHLFLRWKEEIQAQLTDIRMEMERQVMEVESGIGGKMFGSEKAPKTDRESLDDYLSLLEGESGEGKSPYTYQDFLSNSENVATNEPNKENGSNIDTSG